MKKTIGLTAFTLLIAGCTRPAAVTQTLEAQGYTDIEITGYDILGCSEDDTFHTGFRAKGSTGRTVSGTACEGLLFKNRTLRFD